MSKHLGFLMVKQVELKQWCHYFLFSFRDQHFLFFFQLAALLCCKTSWREVEGDKGPIIIPFY